MASHFKFTSKTRIKWGRTLYQIKANIDFKSIKKGQLGGWVEKGAIIDKDCWVHEEAEIFEKAVIRGGEIRGGEIWGGVIRGGEIWGGEIWGGVIWGGVIRGGEIRGGEIRGGVIWGGVIRGGVIWGGEIRGGVIRGGVDVISFCQVGSANGVLTAYKLKDGTVELTRGCFQGSIDKFVEAVKNRHGDTKVAKEYLAMVEIIKLRFDIKEAANV